MLQYLDKGVQLLVTTNGKLQMARSDALHLYTAIWGMNVTTKPSATLTSSGDVSGAHLQVLGSVAS